MGKSDFSDPCSIVLSEIAITTSKSSRVYLILSSNSSAASASLADDSKAKSHKFSAKLPSLTFIGAYDEGTCFTLAVFLANPESKKATPVEEFVLRQQDFTWRHIPSALQPLVLSSSNGITVSITYSLTSPELLAYQLSSTDTRPLVLEDLATMRMAPRFLVYVTHREVIKELLRLLSMFVRKHTFVEADADSIELVWTTLSQNFGALRRVAEVYPDFEADVWFIASKDKGKHSQYYYLVVSILKVLTSTKAGAKMLPHFVDAFSRSCRLCSELEHQNLLRYIAELITYFDIKYIPFLVKKTSLLQDLRLALQSASNEKFSEDLTYQLIGIVRFLGHEHLETLQEAGIFECIQNLAGDTSHPNRQLVAFKALEQFGLNDAQMANTLMDSIQQEIHPNARIERLQATLKMVTTKSIEPGLRIPLALSVVPFLFDPLHLLSGPAVSILSTLNIASDEAVTTMIFKSYVGLLCTGNLQTAEVVLDFVFSLITSQFRSFQRNADPTTNLDESTTLDDHLDRQHLPLLLRPHLIQHFIDIDVFGALASAVKGHWLSEPVRPHFALWANLARSHPELLARCDPFLASVWDAFQLPIDESMNRTANEDIFIAVLVTQLAKMGQEPRGDVEMERLVNLIVPLLSTSNACISPGRLGVDPKDNASPKADFGKYGSPWAAIEDELNAAIFQLLKPRICHLNRLVSAIVDKVVLKAYAVWGQLHFLVKLSKEVPELIRISKAYEQEPSITRSPTIENTSSTPPPTDQNNIFLSMINCLKSCYPVYLESALPRSDLLRLSAWTSELVRQGLLSASRSYEAVIHSDTFDVLCDWLWLLHSVGRHNILEKPDGSLEWKHWFQDKTVWCHLRSALNSSACNLLSTTSLARLVNGVPEDQMPEVVQFVFSDYSPPGLMRICRAALRALICSPVCPDPKNIVDFAKYLHRTWPKLKLTQERHSNLVGFLDRLALLFAFVTSYDEPCFTHILPNREHVKPPDALHMDSYIVRAVLSLHDDESIEQLYDLANITVIPQSHLKDGLSDVPCEGFPSLKHSDFENWNWFERMETARLLLEVLIDFIDSIPLDELFPEAVEADVGLTEEQMMESHPSAEKPFHDKLTLYRYTSSAILDAVAKIYAAAAYPCPSLSKKAMTWVSARFWPNLLPGRDTSFLMSLPLHYNPSDHESFHTTRLLLGEVQNTPRFFYHLTWFMVHYNDPDMIAAICDGLLRAGIWNARQFSNLGYPLLQTVNSIALQYMRHLEEIIYDPFDWEDRFILHPPSESDDSERKNVKEFVPEGNHDVSGIRGSLAQPTGYPLPDPTSSSPPSFESSGVWTDYDELEWFTRPVAQLDPNHRVSPMDARMCAMRNRHMFSTSGGYTSSRPFVFAECSDIPKDVEERRRGVEARASRYLQSFTGAISSLLEVLKEANRFTLFSSDVYPDFLTSELKMPKHSDWFLDPIELEKLSRTSFKHCYLSSCYAVSVLSTMYAKEAISKYEATLPVVPTRNGAQNDPAHPAHPLALPTDYSPPDDKRITPTTPVCGFNANIEVPISVATSSSTHAYSKSEPLKGESSEAKHSKRRFHEDYTEPSQQKRLRSKTMLDFAWRTLGTVSHLHRLPVVIKIYLGLNLSALLEIEKETGDTRLETTHPLWCAYTVPFLQISAMHFPNRCSSYDLPTATSSLATGSSGQSGDTLEPSRDFSVPPSKPKDKLKDNPTQFTTTGVNLNRIDAVMTKAMNGTLLDIDALVESLKASLEASLPPNLAVPLSDGLKDSVDTEATGMVPPTSSDPQSGSLEDCIETAAALSLDWLHRVDRLVRLLTRFSGLVSFNPSLLNVPELLYASQTDAQLALGFPSTTVVSWLAFQYGSVLVKLAAIYKILARNRWNFKWRQECIDQEASIGYSLDTILIQLISTPAQAARFLSDPFWCKLGTLFVSPLTKGGNVFPYRLSALAAMYGVFETSGLEWDSYKWDVKSNLEGWRGETLTKIPRHLAQLTFASLLTHHQNRPSLESIQWRWPEAMEGFASDVCNTKLLGPQVGMYSHDACVRRKRWFLHLKASQTVVERFVVSPALSAANAPREISKHPSLFVGKPGASSVTDKSNRKFWSTWAPYCPTLEIVADYHAIGAYFDLTPEQISSKRISSRFKQISGAPYSSTANFGNFTANFSITLRVSEYLDSKNGLVYARLFNGIVTCFAALPYNRVLNVWWKQFGTYQADGLGKMAMFNVSQLSDLYNNSPFRIGWATQKAIETITEHPFYYVGDVPGSFGFSCSESCMFNEGRTIPILSPHATGSLQQLQLFHSFDIAYNPINRSIHFWAPMKTDGISMPEFSMSMLIPPKHELPEELFPIISCGGGLSFLLECVGTVTAPI